jgi:hypothetical protein
MGNRSYLLVEQETEYCVLLEANNDLPLLWVAMAERAHFDDLQAQPGPSLQLMDGPSYGVDIAIMDALVNLARRRPLVLRWLGDAAATVLDQFAQLLESQQASRLRLDLAEFVQAHTDVAEAQAALRMAADALDTDPAKSPGSTRRPKLVKWLMDGFGLSGVTEHEPRFGLALAGSMDDDSEPWRRDPPRARRLAADRLWWSNTDAQISADGRVIVIARKNDHHLDTPLIWNRDQASSRPMPIPDAIESLYLRFLSTDGRLAYGDCVTFPGPAPALFRYDGHALELFPQDPTQTVLNYGCSGDGSVLTGVRFQEESRWLSRRAFRQEPDAPMVDICPPDIASEASHISPDGKFIAGTYKAGPHDPAPDRAFVWDAQDGLHDIGVEFFDIEWIAISPDGQRGVLRVMYVRGGEFSWFFWNRGQPLQRIEDDSGVPLKYLHVSADVDALLGTVGNKHGIRVWFPGGEVRAVDTSATNSELSPLYIANGGREIVVTVAVENERCISQLLVWSGEAGTRFFPMKIEGEDVNCFWRRTNRCARLADFVTVGTARNGSYPVLWSIGRGMERFPYQENDR